MKEEKKLEEEEKLKSEKKNRLINHFYFTCYFLLLNFDSSKIIHVCMLNFYHHES